MEKFPVDIGKLNEFLNGKLPQECPLCHATHSYSCEKQLMELREFKGNNFFEGQTAIAPLVVLTCGNCGNTILLNAFILRQITADAFDEVNENAKLK